MAQCKECGAIISSRLIYCDDCRKIGLKKICRCCRKIFYKPVSSQSSSVHCPECKAKAHSKPCPKCKKYFLQRKDVNFICPSCGYNKELAESGSILAMSKRARELGMSYGKYVAMRESGMRI